MSARTWQHVMDQITTTRTGSKTDVTSLISFGNDAAEVLGALPRSGLLFPALARIHERHRSKLFVKRLATVGIEVQSSFHPQRNTQRATRHSAFGLLISRRRRAAPTLGCFDSVQHIG